MVEEERLLDFKDIEPWGHSNSLNMGLNSGVEVKKTNIMMEYQKVHAQTMRTQSLATRGDIDPIALVE